METLPLKNSCFFQLSAFEKFQRESKGWSAEGLTLHRVPRQTLVLFLSHGKFSRHLEKIKSASATPSHLPLKAEQKSPFTTPLTNFFTQEHVSKCHAVSTRMVPRSLLLTWNTLPKLPHLHSVLDYPTLAGRKGTKCTPEPLADS